MRLKLIATFFAISSTLLGGPAIAQSSVPNIINGNGLLEACEGNSSLQILCLGYLQGIKEQSIYLEERGVKPMFCIPSSVTNGQLQAVVVKALKERPHQRHYSSASFVSLAWRDAFPCASAKQQPRR